MAKVKKDYCPLTCGECTESCRFYDLGQCIVVVFVRAIERIADKEE